MSGFLQLWWRDQAANVLLCVQTRLQINQIYRVMMLISHVWHSQMYLEAWELFSMNNHSIQSAIFLFSVVASIKVLFIARFLESATSATVRWNSWDVLYLPIMSVFIIPTLFNQNVLMFWNHGFDRIIEKVSIILDFSIYLTIQWSKR